MYLLFIFYNTLYTGLLVLNKVIYYVNLVLIYVENIGEFLHIKLIWDTCFDGAWVVIINRTSENFYKLKLD